LQTLKRSQRPTDQAIEEYYCFAESFFINLAKAIMPIKEFFDAEKEEDIVKKYRGEFGGNILFRPLGLIIITEVIAKITETKSIDYAFAVLKDLPLSLSEKPYVDAFWIRKTSSINPKAKAVVRDMLLIEAKVYTNSAKILAIQQKHDKILNP
jgi:DNA sulfur modification protein DndB